MEAQDELLRTTRLVADTYEQRLDEVRRLESAIAQFPEVRTGDAAACSARLAQIVKLNQPQYPAFGVANLDGDLFCTSAPVSPTVNIADRRWFVEAIRTKDFAIGEFTIARASPIPILGLGYPVFDDNGEVQRVVSHGLRLNQLQAESTSLPLPEDAVLVITDHKGTILVRIPEGEKWMGQPMPSEHFQQMQVQNEGVFEALGVDDVRRLYAFTSVTGPGDGQVQLTIGRTLEVVYAGVNEAIARDVFGVASIMAVLLAAIWLAADRLFLKKIDQLVGATQRLSRGELDARTVTASNGTELDQLGRAFNRMAEVLQQREAENEAQRQRLLVLAEASRAFAQASPNLQPVLEAVVRHLSEVVGDACSLRLPRDDGQTHTLAAVYHPDPEALAFYRELNATPLRPDEGMSGRVFMTGPAPILAGRDAAANTGRLAHPLLAVSRKVPHPQRHRRAAPCAGANHRDAEFVAGHHPAPVHRGRSAFGD
jgi:HAMP domain-containing protein